MKNFFLSTTGIVIISFTIILFSCKKYPVEPMQIMQTANFTDTVTSLAQMKSDVAVWFTDGKYITVTQVVTDEIENDEAEESEDESSRSQKGSCSNNFSGTARKVAKTSYSTGVYTAYSNISTLRTSLQTDTYMISKGLTNSSPRITEEDKNVSVTSAYLYAIARESDNDYHLVIGDANATPATLINCEAGGLPSSSSAVSYSAMKTVRDYLKLHFGTDFCNKSGYTHFSPAIKINVLKGSIFYDVDHLPGITGPAGYRASTSWEIHPINTITF